MHICSSAKLNSLEVVASASDSRVCRFHVKEKTFSLDCLGPQGMCYEAFHQIYPIAFAMLYGTFDEPCSEVSPFIVKCPNAEKTVEFKVYRKPAPIVRQGLNVLLSIRDKFKPTEILHWDVFMAVVNAPDECLQRHKAGDTYKMNLGGNRKECCPAGVYSVAPFLLQSIESNESSAPPACPDHIKDITYTPPGKATGGQSIACADFDALTLEASRVTGTCGAGFAKGDSLSVGRWRKEAKIPCLSLLHSALPYVHAISRGARISFYTPVRGAAVVQCPASKVAVHISSKDKNTIECKVVYLRDECPKGIELDHCFEVSPRVGKHKCNEIAPALLGYLFSENPHDGAGLNCPGREGCVSWVIKEAG
jgi:uncharacterized repeat protein (TIGR04076 family)